MAQKFQLREQKEIIDYKEWVITIEYHPYSQTIQYMIGRPSRYVDGWDVQAFSQGRVLLPFVPSRKHGWEGYFDILIKQAKSTINAIRKFEYETKETN